MAEETPADTSEAEKTVAFFGQKMQESSTLIHELLSKLESLDPEWLGEGEAEYQEAVQRLEDGD